MSPRLSFGAMNRSGPPPVADSFLKLLKIVLLSNVTKTDSILRSGLAAVMFAISLLRPWTSADSAPPPDDAYACHRVILPESFAAACVSAGPLEAAGPPVAGTVVGAVVAPGPQALAARTRLPASAASRNGFFIGVVVSSHALSPVVRDPSSSSGREAGRRPRLAEHRPTVTDRPDRCTRF